MNDLQEIAGIPEESVTQDIKATLDGIGADYVVEVYNPLHLPFRAKFARSVVQPPRLHPDQAEHLRKMANLGVPVSKETPQAHQSTYLILQPGGTLKLPGDVAQVVVRQLVNEILQRTGKKKGLADAFARQQVEQDIIQNYTAIIQATQTSDPQDSFDRQLQELNMPQSKATQTVEHEPEPAFPSYAEAPTTSAISKEPEPIPEVAQTNKRFGRPPGRPAKAQ